MRTDGLVTARTVRRLRWAQLAAVAVAVLVALLWVAWTVPLSALPMLPLGALVTLPMCGFVAWMLVAVHGSQPPWLKAPLSTFVEAGPWTPSPGTVLVGATHPGGGTEVHDGQPFAAWQAKNTPHMLICGSSGSGKTSVMRWFITALLQADYDLVILDGKGAGAVGADFAHLEQVRMVAEDPGDWLEATYYVRDEMRTRYQALRAWRYGNGEKPDTRQIAFVVDELEDVCALGKDRFTDGLFEVTRMGREAGGRVLASILRPDTSTIPGKVRDSLSGRVFMGTLGQTSGLMMFDDKAFAAQEASAAAADIPGRGVALLGGRIHTIQVPLVPEGRDAVDRLLPKGARA